MHEEILVTENFTEQQNKFRLPLLHSSPNVSSACGEEGDMLRFMSMQHECMKPLHMRRRNPNVHSRILRTNTNSACTTARRCMI